MIEKITFREVPMKDDILSILEEKGPSFSKGQRRIAEYITDSYDKAAFMTASRRERLWVFLNLQWSVLL